MTTTLHTDAPSTPDNAAHAHALRVCTAGSVDDGKSTFVGRLLRDTNNVAVDQLEAAERLSNGEELDLSLLVDGLRAEREQGITIDVAYRYFSTPRRTFILADTPGHVQYTRNTVTGMSTSEVAIVLIDAQNGVTDQTRKHLAVARLLGIDTIIFAVNKMDLVDYSAEVFEGIKATLDADDVRFVPISALRGDNVVTRSTAMDWYEGPSVLEILETIEIPAADHAFRFPVQYVLRDNPNVARTDNTHLGTDVRSYAGQVATGSIAVGDAVTISSGDSTHKAHVVGIDSTDGPLQQAEAGASVALRLDAHVDITRGDLIAVDSPEATRSVQATVIGLSDRSERANSGIVNFRYGTAVVRAKVTSGTVALNELNTVELQLASPLPIEPYAARGAVGAFLLIDPQSGDSIAAGLVQ